MQSPWLHGKWSVVAGAIVLGVGGCTASLGEDDGRDVSAQAAAFEQGFDRPGNDGWFDDDGGSATPPVPGDEVPPPPPPPPTPDPDCVPRDLAFWRSAPVWPTPSLEIAGVLYSEAQLRAILREDSHADASLEAAQELIVALLNQCAGCVVPPELQETIDRCDDWFRDNVGWDFDGDGAIPYCIPPGDELAGPITLCRDRLRELIPPPA